MTGPPPLTTKSFGVGLLADHMRFAPDVAQLVCSQWGDTIEHWNEIVVREAGRENLPVSWVAWRGDQLLGKVGLGELDIAAMQDRGPWVLGMIVEPTERGRGVGRALLLTLEESARLRGFHELWVATKNARSFYERCGWSYLKSATDNDGEACSVLRKDLMELREHDVVIQGENVVLRPMLESDWDTLLAWNQDPEVLEWADSSTDPKSLSEVQGIYRGVSQHAFNFVIEVELRPIGECWLQEMNLQRIRTLYPEEDVRRIDIMIGAKDCWGRGYGSDAIRALTMFGLNDQNCDRIVACCVRSDNLRSIRAFESAGFRIVRKFSGATDCRVGLDLEIERDLR